VGDITFIPTAKGWLYLAVLIDLYSRRVVGWAMSERIDQQLVLDALNMALLQRPTWSRSAAYNSWTGTPSPLATKRAHGSTCSAKVEPSKGTRIFVYIRFPLRHFLYTISAVRLVDYNATLMNS
jgi:hypothetical protein